MRRGGEKKLRRDGPQIRTIPGTQRGVFYTESTLAEQKGVLRQGECAHFPAERVLAGEGLCTATAPDKHTGA